MTKKRIAPAPNQESVWDYPRPPRVEEMAQHIRIVFNGRTIADTHRAFRVLETSHPPVYYIPMEDVLMDMLTQTGHRTWCEWKGQAHYHRLDVGDRYVENAAWFYPNPTPGFEAIRGCVAFYPGKMDSCTVDGERVQAQPGDFYGGWITANIVGPFKGGPGTAGW